MKNERGIVIAGMVCLFVLIFAVVCVTILYMRDEPAWNRATAAPLVEYGQNRPPGLDESGGKGELP